MIVHLSITEEQGHYAFRLKGEGIQIDETVDKDIINESVGTVRSYLAGEINEDEAHRWGFPTRKERFAAQANKEYLTIIGSFIYNNLVPKRISDALARPGITYLSTEVDNALADIPWEFIYNGEDFFCLKYAIGRKIKLSEKKETSQQPKDAIRFLLIEDPSGSLPASRNEINYLVGQLRTLPGVKVRRAGMEMRKKDFLTTVSKNYFDILHYSGHGFFDSDSPSKSYLVFYDYKNPCYAFEIAQSLKGRAPALVFGNACSSAQSMVGLQGIAQAFMSSGTVTYIGTLWPVEDQLAGMIGENFYRYLIYGKTVGEALRLARINAHKKFGWTSLSWAAFVLLGDPTRRLSLSSKGQNNLKTHY